MDVYEAMRSRYSVRSYLDQPVEEEKLQRMLAAAQAAPSAKNRQMWRLVVVRDADLRQALADAAEQEFLAEAPVVLAMVGLTPGQTMSCQIQTDPVDCAIALDHIALTAVAEGLGTCWIGHFDQDQCREILGVPDRAEIIELMPVGYPAVAAHPKQRKSLEELVCFDKFE